MPKYYLRVPIYDKWGAITGYDIFSTTVKKVADEYLQVEGTEVYVMTKVRYYGEPKSE